MIEVNLITGYVGEINNLTPNTQKAILNIDNIVSITESPAFLTFTFNKPIAIIDKTRGFEMRQFENINIRISDKEYVYSQLKENGFLK